MLEDIFVIDQPLIQFSVSVNCHLQVSTKRYNPHIIPYYAIYQFCKMAVMAAFFHFL
jgi:hypothetical protein